MRNPSTYRSERREEWKRVKAVQGGDFPWENYNTPAPKYHLGSVQAPVALIQRRTNRSKYMPHNGKQEMARRVAQLDALIDRYMTSIMANVSIIANDEAA